jgi:hypothetical protein
MNTKNREIFKRIGAGLMLGLSLLGFGSSARGSSQTAQLPKRIKNLRQKEKQQVELDSHELLTMIEKEAQAAVRQENLEQDQADLLQMRQQDNLNKLTVGQRIFRFGVLGVWGISIGTFFTSLIFNTPIDLGKKVLSVLPGIPHTASLKVALSEESKNGDKIKTNLLFDSDEYPVVFTRSVLKYDPEKIEFSGYRLLHKNCREIRVNELKRDDYEILEIIFQPEKAAAFEQEKIIQLDFDTIRGNELVEIDLIQPESLVIANTKEGEYDVLGSVSGVKFLTKEEKTKMMTAGLAFSDENPADVANWQEFIKGNLSKEGSGYWQELDDDKSFVCSKKGDEIYFLLAQLNENEKETGVREIKKIALNIQSGEGSDEYSGQRVSAWESGEAIFSIFKFQTDNHITDSINFFAEFFGDNYAVKWPAAGSFGLVVFE